MRSCVVRRVGFRRRWMVIAGVVAAVAVIALAVFLGSSATAPRPRAPGPDAGVAAAGPAGSASTAGSGVKLVGTVVDSAGSPVAGVVVQVEPEHTVDRAPATTTPTVNGWPTTGDGNFAVGGLVPGRYRIRVTGGELVPAELRFVPIPSDAVRIVVARQVAIDGVVMDGATATANVTVALRGDPIGGVIETKSDLKGAFRFLALPEGRYQVFGWRGGLAARAVRVSRVGAGPFGPVELRLEAATIVIGRVIDRDEGSGIVAAVELRATADDHPPRYARSDSDGVFRIEGVPSGRWIADAFAPGYISPNGVELEAGRGIPELALARGATVEGRVVDGAGKPIAGATVRALAGAAEHSAQVDRDKLRRFSGWIAAPMPSTGGLGAALGPALGLDQLLVSRGELGVMVGPIPPIPPPGALIARPSEAIASVAGGRTEPAELPVVRDASVWTTTGDGRYRIRGLTKAAIAVIASATGFADGRTRQVTVEPGQLVSGLDVVLGAGTMIAGRVTDQHGVPVVGALITARPDVGTAIDGFSDGMGNYRVGPVTGAIELVGSAHGHANATRVLDLAAPRGGVVGEQREDLVLAVADAVLEGSVDDMTGAPVAGAQLEVISGPAQGRRANVAADGTFAITMIPLGPIRVRIRHPAYPVTDVDAEATRSGQGRARLRLPIGGGADGVVLDRSLGTPIASVTVVGAGPNGATAEAASDRSGRWKLAALAPGRWALAITLPGYVPLRHEVEVLAAATPGTTTVRDVRLELVRGALLGGTVRDARGQRVARAQIIVRQGDGAGIEARGTSDSAGEFRIRDCPTGDIVVTASSGDRRGSTRASVRPGDEALGLAIELE